MRWQAPAVGAAPLLPGLLPTAAHAAAPNRPDFPLVKGGAAVDLFVDSADDPAVVRAAGDLQADVERVSGVRPHLRHTVPENAARLVLVGTIGASPVIDRLIARTSGWTSPG